MDLSNQDDVGEYQSFDTVEELIEDLHDDQSTPLKAPIKGALIYSLNSFKVSSNQLFL